MLISYLSIKVATYKIKQRLQQDTFIPLSYGELNLNNPVPQYSEVSGSGPL